MLHSGDYVEKLFSYKVFIKYLKDNFYNIDESLDDIKNLIVLDYIYSSQTCTRMASDASIDHIREMFDVTIAEAQKMQKLIKRIYDEYPKWVKRGNI